MNYFYLHIILLLQVFSAICLKFAAGYNVLSIQFISLYILGIFFLMIYAFFWQKILIHFDLSIAYLNSAIVMIWIIFIGLMIWNEPLTINKIIAVICIVIGIYFISSKGNTNV